MKSGQMRVKIQFENLHTWGYFDMYTEVISILQAANQNVSYLFNVNTKFLSLKTDPKEDQRTSSAL